MLWLLKVLTKIKNQFDLMPHLNQNERIECWIRKKAHLDLLCNSRIWCYDKMNSKILSDLAHITIPINTMDFCLLSKTISSKRIHWNSAVVLFDLISHRIDKNANIKKIHKQMFLSTMFTLPNDLQKSNRKNNNDKTMSCCRSVWLSGAGWLQAVTVPLSWHTQLHRYKHKRICDMHSKWNKLNDGFD